VPPDSCAILVESGRPPTVPEGPGTVAARVDVRTPRHV
jgi:hypothetical protein